jgi:hypothetical protein
MDWEIISPNASSRNWAAADFGGRLSGAVLAAPGIDVFLTKNGGVAVVTIP